MRAVFVQQDPAMVASVPPPPAAAPNGFSQIAPAASHKTFCRSVGFVCYKTVVFVVPIIWTSDTWIQSGSAELSRL